MYPKCGINGGNILNIEFDEYITNMLTEREIQVAQFVVMGFNNSQIAKKMHLSIHSIKVVLAKTYIKLNVVGRVNLAYILGQHTKDNSELMV